MGIAVGAIDRFLQIVFGQIREGLGDLLVSGVVEASPDSPRSGLLVTGK